MPAGISAWTPLANITLGGSQASVTFSSINAGYRDLFLVASFDGSTNERLRMRVNGDAGGTYSTVNVLSTTSSGRYTQTETTTFFNFSASSNFGGSPRCSAEIHIMDYAQTDKHKGLLAKSYASEGYTSMLAGRWASTSAINSVNIYTTGTFPAGSTFALYGVSA